ncbi:MAG: efflux RND transporter permease subunit [Sphingobacteriales bacterium]|nr:MAG: efflux RND transporter permease subunit [Sphingobacteriales bacterium]
MERIYQSPLKVYLTICLLTFLGLFCFSKLPLTLFPKVSKPSIIVTLGYGSLSPLEFRNLYGAEIEAGISQIKSQTLPLIRSELGYYHQRFWCQMDFEWGTDPERARLEVERMISSIGSRMSDETRRSISVTQEGNPAQIVVSFSHKNLSHRQLYSSVEPLIRMELGRIPGIENVSIINPDAQEIVVEVDPLSLAQHNIRPSVLENTITQSMNPQGGGLIQIESGSIPIYFKAGWTSLSSLRDLPLSSGNSSKVILSTVANVVKQKISQSDSQFRVNGHDAIVMKVNPKIGYPISRMSDQIRLALENIRTKIGPGFEANFIIDPSVTIRVAIQHLLGEVALGSILAALVLFIFLGNIRQVFTAAVEIPLSIIFSFIPLYLFNVDLNLISLAGLALSAGMNVDASVVVLENILSRTSTHGNKANQIFCAVREVRRPIIISTLCSLIVYLPFLFMRDLGEALLGDLVKAVIFSHGSSAFIALILVPTVRLHLLQKVANRPSYSFKSRIGSLRVNEGYRNILVYLLKKTKTNTVALITLCAGLVFLSLFIIFGLNRELIAEPRSKILILNLISEEPTSSEYIRNISAKLRDRVAAISLDQKIEVVQSYEEITKVQNSRIFFSFISSSDLEIVKTQIDASLRSLIPSGFQLSTERWVASEFAIPRPPDFKIAITGGDPSSRIIAARDLEYALTPNLNFKEIYSDPTLPTSPAFSINIKQDVLNNMQRQGFSWDSEDLQKLVRFTADGKDLGEVILDGQRTSVRLKSSVQSSIKKHEDIEALPLQFGNNLIPLKVVAVSEIIPNLYAEFKENGQDLALVVGKFSEVLNRSSAENAKSLGDELDKWRQKRLPILGISGLKTDLVPVSEEIRITYQKITYSLIISFFLIGFIVFLEFERMRHILAVLIVIPLGFAGAVLSLKIFNSTLSINSLLGMIMLSGLGVNNSILFVDYFQNLQMSGFSNIEAALMSADARLNPILITTITTILAMLPLALGFGDNGNVNQPLGIAVAGGLWFSTFFMLLVVPLILSIGETSSEIKKDYKIG